MKIISHIKNFEKFAKNIEKIGNLFIDYSKKLLNTLNELKDQNQITLINEDNFSKNPRFEKVVVEEINKIEDIKDINKIQEQKKEDNNDDLRIDKKSISDTPMGPKSKNNIFKDDFFDFDIIDKSEISFKEIEDIKNSEKNKKKAKGINLIDKIKALKKGDKTEKNLEIKNKSRSSGSNEFQLIGNNSLKNEIDYQEKNDKLLDNIIKKMISKDELLSQEISQLMKLLKEENPSTNKLYSYTFLIILIS